MKPSMTISAVAGTSSGTVRALAISIGAPASAPATPISSISIASFCGPVNMTTGAQPTTIAMGIRSRRLRYLSQCR
jgi:hypothetical protein